MIRPVRNGLQLVMQKKCTGDSLGCLAHPILRSDLALYAAKLAKNKLEQDSQLD
jgi:hypothetical protein